MATIGTVKNRKSKKPNAHPWTPTPEPESGDPYDLSGRVGNL